MQKDRSEYRQKIVTVLGALAVIGHLCVLGLVLSKGNVPLVWDSADYWKLAGRVAGGDFSLLPFVYRTPGYPYFLGALRWIFGPSALFFVCLIQLLLVFGTTLLVAYCAKQVTGSRLCGVLVLWVSLFQMNRYELALFVLSDTLLCFLVALVFTLCLRFSDRSNVMHAIFLGVALGSAILVKPVAQLLFVPVSLYCLWALRIHQKLSWAKTFLLIGSTSAAIFLVCLPWLARNKAHFGKHFLTQFTGRVFWESVYVTGPRHLPFPKQMNEKLKLAPSVNLRNTWETAFALQERVSEGQADALMWEMAKASILSHPGDFLFNTASRIRAFWNSRPVLGESKGTLTNSQTLSGLVSPTLTQLYGSVRGVFAWGPKMSQWLRYLSVALVFGLLWTVYAPAALLAAAFIGYFVTIVCLSAPVLYRYFVMTEPLFLFLGIVGTYGVLAKLLAWVRFRNDAKSSPLSLTEPSQSSISNKT